MKGLFNFHFLNPLFLIAIPLVWALWLWMIRKKKSEARFVWTGAESKKLNL